jgi:4-hydroxybenzoyl-CoA reductase subunit beta
MRLPSFAYNAPNSLGEALKIKEEQGNAASVLAGGTGLLVNLKHRLLQPASVISLKNIKELRGIEVKNDSLIVRAGTSLMDTARHEAVREYFPLLVRAIESIGAVGIQGFRGTIGGNMCLQPRCIFYNQSAFWRSGKGLCNRTGGKECLALEGSSQSCQSICSGDTVPALTALSAQVVVAGSSGSRSFPITEFFTGKGESPFLLLPNEILTEIRLPLPWARGTWSFQRISMRAAVDFPLVNAAATAIMQAGRVETVRLVLCAVGPGPVLLKEAEGMMKGRIPDQEMADHAAGIARRSAEGMIVDNAAVSREYRIKMAGTVVKRAVKEILGLS